jgi:hypothetical protein
LAIVAFAESLFLPKGITEENIFYYKTGIIGAFLVNFLHNSLLLTIGSPMKPAQLTQTISDTLVELRKSERKVAEFVLKEHADCRSGATGRCQ